MMTTTVNFQSKRWCRLIPYDPLTLPLTSQLMKCDEKALSAALTHRTIEVRGDVVVSPLTVEQVRHA